jgi:hypothetical protein
MFFLKLNLVFQRIYDDIGDYVPDMQKRVDLYSKKESHGNNDKSLQKPTYFTNKSEPEKDRYRVIKMFSQTD